MRKLGFLVLGVLIGIGAGEIILALSGLQSRYPEHYMANPVTGVSLRPGARTVWSQEGCQLIEINSEGLRDLEHRHSKPADCLRIAILGDSYAEALQVSLDETFWWVMGRRLQDCPAVGGKTVEPINFGVSGYGTAQELLTLRHRVWQYSPDVVILAVTTGNDIRNNSPELEPDSLRPFFTVNDSSELVLDKSFAQNSGFKKLINFETSNFFHIRRHLRGRSRIYQLLARIRSTVGRATSHQVEEPRQEPGLDDGVYLPPTDDRWVRAWEVTEKLIVSMQQEVTNRGARFILVTLSSPIQVDPDEEERARFLEALGPGADLYYPDRRLERLALDHGIDAVILAPVLGREASRHHVYLHGFPNTHMGQGHWNADGHRLAGNVIAERVCQALSGS